MSKLISRKGPPKTFYNNRENRSRQMDHILAIKTSFSGDTHSMAIRLQPLLKILSSIYVIDLIQMAPIFSRHIEWFSA